MEARRVFRSRVANPRWIGSMMRHGYKGAFELSATVDYLFGYDATTGVVEDWMYEQVTEKYVGAEEVRDFLAARTPGRSARSPSGCWRPPSAGCGRRPKPRRWSSCARPTSTSRASSRRLRATSPPSPSRALVGQDELREALLACAVDPAIGGVLVRGERGTAKTTAVRGLAPLLGGGALVELPIGATADRVLGTLDLDRALSEGRRPSSPGCSRRRTAGCSTSTRSTCCPTTSWTCCSTRPRSARVHVERDGMSTSYDARFLLVGTMNPEEGDLRPQLLDRFGLSRRGHGQPRPERARGDRPPPARVRPRPGQPSPPRSPARSARWPRASPPPAKRLNSVRLPDRILLLIAGTCARLGVDGHRADIVTARTATALAALDGADEVDAEHVRRAARLALAHRRRRGPLQQPGLDDSELDDALAQSEPDDDPDPPPQGGQTPRTNPARPPTGTDAPNHDGGQTPRHAESSHDGGRTPAPSDVGRPPVDAQSSREGDRPLSTSARPGGTDPPE